MTARRISSSTTAVLLGKASTLSTRVPRLPTTPKQATRAPRPSTSARSNRATESGKTVRGPTERGPSSVVPPGWWYAGTGVDSDSLARSVSLSFRATCHRGAGRTFMTREELTHDAVRTRVDAVERVGVASTELSALRDEYENAKGTTAELHTEGLLKAANDEVGARERWL